MSLLLELVSVQATYGGTPALHGIDLEVGDGEVVALLGANGAGKTTVLRAISRTVRTTGGLRLAGAKLAGLGTDRVSRMGVGHVPQGRGTFGELTVHENLRLGLLARPRSLRRGGQADLEAVLDLFGALREMADRPAGALSGGQQQMLAIGRALLARPKLLMLDEPSLGLAPMTATAIFAALGRLREEWGLALIVAEQNVPLSLGIADRAYLLETGRVTASGAAGEMADDPAVRRAYLGD